MTDTDRQTHGHSIYRARMASGSKNCQLLFVAADECVYLLEAASDYCVVCSLMKLTIHIVCAAGCIT